MCRLACLPSCKGTLLLSLGIGGRLRMPCLRPLHQLTLLVPISLLDLADKLVIAPIDFRQVVVGKCPPLLFQFAFELHPSSFELISVHLILLPSPACAYMDMSARVHHPFLSQVLSYGVKVNPTGL